MCDLSNDLGFASIKDQRILMININFKRTMLYPNSLCKMRSGNDPHFCHLISHLHSMELICVLELLKKTFGHFLSVLHMGLFLVKSGYNT